MEAEEELFIMIQERMVEAHMIQYFQALNSNLVVEEGVAVEIIMIARVVEQEDLVDHPFVYLLRRLRLMDQS